MHQLNQTLKDTKSVHGCMCVYGICMSVCVGIVCVCLYVDSVSLCGVVCVCMCVYIHVCRCVCLNVGGVSMWCVSVWYVSRCV